MKVLGITGGIGSGKSVVACIFKTLGVAVYNSDERAKEIYFDTEVRKQVESLLGKEAYRDKTRLDKKYISSKIFSDKILLEKLNGIIHPAVAKDFSGFKRLHLEEKYVVKESALLVEAGLLQQIDKLLLVISNDLLRTERLKKRDGMSTDEIEKITSKQLPDKEKIKKADWVLENNEEELLIPQVITIHKSLTK